ncbi:unnamed protein product, partial [Polarella glacialis]
ECNWNCGLSFPSGTSKKDKHKHRSEECPARPVRCEKCQTTDIKFKDLELHETEMCPAQLLECDQCHLQVERKKLELGAQGEHKLNECEQRIVRCQNGDECTWSGPWQTCNMHDEKCPFAYVECPECLERLHRWEMREHLCPLIDGADVCIVCTETWAERLQKGVPPALLIMESNGTCRRACGHLRMCLDC